MFKRLRAVVTRRKANLRPEEAVGPEDWFDRQYSKEIRLKHVSIGALCFAAGATFPSMFALAATGQYWPAAFFAACCGFGLLHAIPQARQLITWQWLDRRRALDKQEECTDLQCELAQVREQYRDLHFNYCVLSACIEQTAEDKTEGAQIIHFRGERRDH